MKKPPIWALGISLFIVGFIITLVIFGIRTARVPFDLVSQDYYEQELAFQDRIDAQARAEKLEEKPSVAAHATQATLTLPASIADQLTSGHLLLYRPSDAAHDSVTAIEPGQNEIHIDLKDKPKGHWKAKLTWTMDGTTYYQETTLLL